MTMQDPGSQPHAHFPVTTAFEFPEYDIQRTLGTTFGIVVRSMGVARGFLSIFRTVAGGEVKQYTKLLEDSRRHAMDRLVENARIMGANGIIAMRFDASEIGQALTEIAAYGTAVVLAPRSR